MVHELGHMLLAKKNHIGVNEFSIGMGPVLASFVKGETKYSIRLFPFGGACMFEGEDGISEKSNSFQNASVFARISAVAAGPVFNFILAYILALFFIGGSGYDEPVVSGVIPGYGAEEIGIQPGDVIKKLGKKKIHLYKEISFYSMTHEGEETPVVYERDGKTYKGVLVPKRNEETGRYLFGLQGSGESKKGNALEILRYSAYEVKYCISTTVDSLKMMFQGKLSKDDVSGPIGMAVFIGDVYEASSVSGWQVVAMNMLSLTILISANLGVMNLLPLPALGGGRLVFLIIELFRGKKIDPEKEGIVHFIGLVLLMMLMVFIMYNDIQKFFL